MKTALLLLAMIAAADGPVPKLTDAQKLEVRNAQIEVLQTKNAYDQAQARLNGVIAKVEQEAKIDPAKFVLRNDLEFAPVEAPKKDTK